MSTLVWFLPILSGMADAAKRGVIKLTEVHVFTLLGFGYLLATPWYLLWLAFEWPREITPDFWEIIAMHVPLLVVAMILTVEAHRVSPLMTTAPYLALTPAFLLVTAPLMDAGIPTVWGALGVMVITIGVYVINTRDDQIGVITPLLNLARDRGAKMMFAVAVIYSITANLDYLGWKRSNEPFFLLVAHGLVGIVSLMLAAIYVAMGKLEWRSVTPRGSWKPLMLFGVMIAAMVMPQMLAFRWIPNVPYVIIGKRAGFMLFTVCIALGLGTMKRYKEKYADEKKHLAYRLAGTAVIFVGMMIIVLYGKA